MKLLKIEIEVSDYKADEKFKEMVEVFSNDIVQANAEELTIRIRAPKE